MARSQLRHSLQSMFYSGLAVGIMNFLAQIAFARILGISIISDYAKIMVAVQIIILFSSFGFNHSVIGKGFTSRRFQNCLALTLLQIGFAALLFVMMSVALGFLYPSELARLAPPALLLIIGALAFPLAHAFNTEIECNLEYGKLAMMRLAAFICANGVAALLCFFQPGEYVLPLRDFVNGVVYLFLSYSCLKHVINVRLDKKTARELISYTKKVWLLNLSFEGGRRLDFALVGLTLSPLMFGIYFQIRNLADGVLGFFLYPIQSALFSYLSKHKNNFKFRKVILGLLPVAIILCLSAGLVSYFLGRLLIIFLLGEEWAAGAVMLIPLAIYATISIYFEILQTMSKALDQMKPIIIARIANILTIAVLVPISTLQYGIKGAAWATAFAAVVMISMGAVLLYQMLAARRRA